MSLQSGGPTAEHVPVQGHVVMSVLSPSPPTVMTRCKFLIINMGADLQCERSPCSVCAFTGECRSPPCITLVGLPRKPQTSIAGGEKTTKSPSLSLCDSLGLLPKQIGLARRSPLHHLSGGRMRKGGSGRCSRLEVYIQTDMSRSVK